jgi:hypothetical protein
MAVEMPKSPPSSRPEVLTKTYHGTNWSIEDHDYYGTFCPLTSRLRAVRIMEPTHMENMSTYAKTPETQRPAGPKAASATSGKLTPPVRTFWKQAQLIIER